MLKPCVLVSKGEYAQTLNELCNQEYISFDTETTGLEAYHGDEIFSFAVATPSTNYYFNFNRAVDIPASLILDKTLIPFFQKVIDSAGHVFIHNAKFDMRFTRMLDWSCVQVHCTLVQAKLLNNERKSYSLDAVASLFGQAKDRTVEDYIKKNKLSHKRERAGKEYNSKMYNKVPFQMIAEYAMRDAQICLDIGIKQLNELRKMPVGTTKNPMRIVRNEVKLTRTLYQMENTGVLCDVEYCRKAYDEQNFKLEEELYKFAESTGNKFMDSGVLFTKVFWDSDADKFTKSSKGNYEFNKHTLEKFDHPAAKMVTEIRKLKSETDFFQQFLFSVDYDSVIHTDYRQAGTRTGRFSSANPNMQNLKKNDTDLNSNLVRRAIVPRENSRLFMIDYDQMEYRLMLDYAGSKSLIDLVLGGLDVHTATAKVANVERSIAKNVNFGTIYGQGMDSLAASIGCSKEEAKKIQASIFDAAPEIKSLIDNVKAAALSRRYIYNWAGRKYMFPYRNMSYKAPNTLIQGGAAEVVRFAMTEIDEFLVSKKAYSRMLLNVHDELIFEIVDGEEDLVSEIKKIMETVYPCKYLPLTCGVDFSSKSWADKEKWNG